MILSKKRKNNEKRALSSLSAITMFAISLIVAGGGAAIYYNSYYTLHPIITTAVNTPTTTASNATYKLTLEITVNNAWNSTVSGPRYWVVTSHGLVDSANLSLPAYTPIQLTIIDYDSATGLPAQFSHVTGTAANLVYVVNGTSAASVNMSAAKAVDSLNPDTEVGHTFTVPQLGLNIPVAANSVEVADFTLNQTGTFVWHCEDPCGYGTSGWEGPMSTNGWMGGTLTVS